MKKVSEAAIELNVSQMTIYRRLGALEGNFTEKKGNATYITDEGMEALRASLTNVKQMFNDDKLELNDVKQMLNDDKIQLNNVRELLNNVEQAEDSVKQDADNEILFLREQNILLQQALIKAVEHDQVQSDKIASQAEKIVSLAEQLADLVRNNQILLGAEQSRTLNNPEAKEQSHILIDSEASEQSADMPKKKKWRWFGIFGHEGA